MKNTTVVCNYFTSSCQNREITYIYDSTEAKLEKIVNTGSFTDGFTTKLGVITHTQYDGSFIFEHQDIATPQLKFFSHAEGYVESNGNNFAYVYQYKDHTSTMLSAGLGNIRLSYKDNNGNLVIVEENNESFTERSRSNPFGLKHKGYNNQVTSTNLALNYKYNGKELNEELDLNRYDYGARNYDAALGRWMNIDPLAENGRGLSPYNFAFNNPISFIDPDGRWPNCPPGVNCGFVTGLTFVFGTSTSLRANVTASVSVANNYQQMNFDFSFGVYLFGQGTSSRVGNLQYDLTASGIATGGFGQGINLPIYTLNSYTRSAFGNDFMYSLS